MTIEETYKEWRSLLKSPDDSLFYYHKDLGRILLGLAIFVIASRPLFQKLGKAEAISKGIGVTTALKGGAWWADY